ncbi:OsmC family protein [Nocardioides sp. cx-173]|uniref:OsmC family protein n=1 Tax=Nocardioides sp. cx-173 TaxID=2898796 RepID=UPI001E56898E|nr:OsmC family protein [Nocardioides sp. cx-173]MCD4526845.1 OsmC family protein [Nocardioides sp. cx-173]UGB43946.1 OsmC family protein [Nocardioides sp. cx-173]
MTTQPAPETGPDTWRGIDLTRIGEGRYKATNARGGLVPIGSGGDDPDFTPVELLLAALAGCAAVTVDELTSRRAEPLSFDMTAEGHKVRDDGGQHLVGLTVTFDVTFPEGEAGDAAREFLPLAVRKTHERICTVSRTVELGTPVTYTVAEPHG